MLLSKSEKLQDVRINTKLHVSKGSWTYIKRIWKFILVEKVVYNLHNPPLSVQILTGL